MEYNYSDLKKKSVVNVLDGKNLGKIIDLIISYPSGLVTGLVVPGRKNSFFGGSELLINFKCIERIGDDTILVKLCESPSQTTVSASAPSSAKIPSGENCEYEE